MFDLLILTAEVFAFIGIHHKTKFIDQYPNGWRQITLYAIGVLFTLPFFVLLTLRKFNAFAAYIISFMGAGVGTAFGYMSTDLMRYKEQ